MGQRLVAALAGALVLLASFTLVREALRGNAGWFLLGFPIVALLMLFWVRLLRRELREYRQGEVRIEATQRLLREVTDRIPGGVVYQFQRSADGHYKANFVSDGVRHVSRLTREQALQDFHGFIGTIAEEDRARVMAGIEESARTMRPYVVEYRLERSPGRHEWVRGSAEPRAGADGAVIWNGFITDIGELKRAQQAAEAASHAKSEFLANISHEIRTPMNAIIGLSHIALEESQEPRVRDYLERIGSAGRALLRIINDVLDLSKIEAGKLVLESTVFELREIVVQVQTMLALRASEKGIELRCRVEPGTAERWVGDPLRLTQVLLNLVGNAVKFTERGHVELRLAEYSRDGQRAGLECSVEDSGIGIAEEHVASLFEPFFQADASTTRRYGGTGLGLSISRRIVDQMGGQIECRSRPGEGSCFTVRVPLPVAPAAGNGAAEPAPPATHLDRMELLARLSVQLDGHEAEAARTVDRLAEAWSGRAAAPALQELAQLVHGYRYAEARERLRTLRLSQPPEDGA